MQKYYNSNVLLGQLLDLYTYLSPFSMVLTNWYLNSFFSRLYFLLNCLICLVFIFSMLRFVNCCLYFRVFGFFCNGSISWFSTNEFEFPFGIFRCKIYIYIYKITKLIQSPQFNF